ncbi:MAG TPA: cation-translocating P-type ATPase, partial [Tepidisphaeraceae bacterium]|nr:cation-translocating P-type ATPase [Tepidisphaeraceae bacterium]
MSHDHDHSHGSETDTCALRVEGMDCASCVAVVDKSIRKLPGIQEVHVNLARGRASVTFDPNKVKPEAIRNVISDSGYKATIAQNKSIAMSAKVEADQAAANERAWRMRAIIGVALWLPVELAHWILHFSSQHSHAATTHDPMIWVSFASSTLALLLIGWAFFRSALKALARGSTNMDTLISMGALVAWIYSTVSLTGVLAGWWQTLPELYFMESSGLLALISIGHWLEARARDRAGDAIRSLMRLAPDTAIRLSRDAPHLSSGPSRLKVIDTTETVVDVSDLVPGDRVIVKPGSRVPIDGVIESGKTTIDESMVSGESVPVVRTVGQEVIGATMNIDGAITVRVTRVGEETALAQIVKLVETAQNARPPVQQMADKISAIFVPIVLVIALLVAIGWYVYGTQYGIARGWTQADVWARVAKATCSVLIVACPCALGIALPAALMVGTGWGAKRGILIRSLSAIENAARVKLALLDKTGTITEGKPKVYALTPTEDIDPLYMLSLAASAESKSSHPLAAAIITHARERGAKLLPVEDFQNIAGEGIAAKVDGRRLRIGRPSVTKNLSGTGVEVIDETNPNQKKSLGIITLLDVARPDSAIAIDQLKSIGVDVAMLTGDNEIAAKRVASSVGIETIFAGVRPEGKAKIVETQKTNLKARDEKFKVAMVGDGINDAPALAVADVGIALGSGSDIAKETGDIVIVSSSLQTVALTICLSRVTMTTIRQNLFWAFFYNVLAIPIAAAGYFNPMIAAGAMALSDVFVVGNALLIRAKMARAERDL